MLRGLCADWEAARLGAEDPTALAAYLVERSNDQPAETWFGEPGLEGRFGYTADFSGFNHERKLATLAQIAELLLRQLGHDAPWSVYAGGVPVRKHLPALLSDIPMPLIDVADDMLVSLWIGNRTRTAAHWDLPQNLACVIGGRRRFTLFPTAQVRNLYVGPLDFTLAGQPTSLVDVEEPDFERFPLFAEALDAAQVAELGPGDALYMPSLWWHAVTSLEPFGAMVNFWWRDGPRPLLTPLNALYYSILTVKDLPPREREAWRTLFDHYVFQDHGDPAAHLPEPARGILGRRTPELVAKVRAMLAKVLSR